MVDEVEDLIITKYHYSAFKGTFLLEALRKKIIFNIYFCGCLINIGIYSLVVDVVGYGLHITIIKDCVGSQSKEKYEEAMSGLVEIIGVNAVDNEGIINELGGVSVLDIDTALY